MKRLALGLSTCLLLLGAGAARATLIDSSATASGAGKAGFSLPGSASTTPDFFAHNGAAAGSTSGMLAWMASDRSYLVLHSRAFSMPTDVREPHSLALFGVGALGLTLLRRRSRRRR
jgi:hypothetical protein